MDCSVPSSYVIPAVAARLKYYVDIERKEIGFDLSSNPRDTNEKYRLYEQTGYHTLHQNQRIKKHFIEKQMEAALRHHTIKSEDKNDQMETKQERRRQVQRKIKKNMSALVMPEYLPCVYPSSINQKLCDLEGLSLNPPDLSHGEFKRLVASAADLIVDNVTANNKNVDYEIIVHVGSIFPTDASPSLFMRLIGDNGKSKTILLQNILYNVTASRTGQVVSSHVKAKDVGELKQIMVGVDDQEQDCRCYCISIIVLKGKTNYVFYCNQWLSHQMIMICATECDSMDSHSQAKIKGAETHQTQAKTCKLSDKSNNTLDYNNNPSMRLSKIDDLNSCENMRKVETSKKGEINACKNSAKVNAYKKHDLNLCESMRKDETSEKDNLNSCESIGNINTSTKDDIKSCESKRKIETSKKDDLKSHESKRKIEISTKEELKSHKSKKKIETSTKNDLKSHESNRKIETSTKDDLKSHESKRKIKKSMKDDLKSHESNRKIETSTKDDLKSQESKRKIETSTKDYLKSYKSKRKVETSKKDDLKSHEDIKIVETSTKDDLQSHKSKRKVETSKKHDLKSHEGTKIVEKSRKGDLNALEDINIVETSRKHDLNALESIKKVESSMTDTLILHKSMINVETSKKDVLNSCESTKNVQNCEANDSVNKISSTESEVSMKVKAKKLDVSQTNNSKSPGPTKIYKNKASKRKVLKTHDLSDVTYCKEETSVISNQNGKGQGRFDQDCKLDNIHVSNIKEDDSVNKSVPENITTDNISKERKDPNEDLQEQKTITTDGLPDLEHRRASSPASYVFFSYETQEPPVLDKVYIHDRRNTGSSMNPNSRDENTNPTQGTTERASCSSLDNNRDNNDGSSKLYLLQQILLESEGNLKDILPRAKSPPFLDNLESPEKTEVQYEKSDQSNEVQSGNAQTGAFDGPLDTEAVKQSDCLCSCEDCCSYESDSTFNEEYLFSDSSWAPSEDEDYVVFSKSAKLDKDIKESPQQMLEFGTSRPGMRIKSNYRVYKERKVNSCIENSDIFQSSMTAIRNSDVNSLRNICHSYFFLPSMKDEGGKTLLHHAAAQENPHIIKVLLDTTVGILNIDQRDILNKTALQYAVEKGNPETIKLLLDRGANAEIPDKSLKTVLDIALWKM